MTARSANEWREFWRTRGERELAGLLDEYEPCATRVATLLGSRAPRASVSRTRTVVVPTARTRSAARIRSHSAAATS